MDAPTQPRAAVRCLEVVDEVRHGAGVDHNLSVYVSVPGMVGMNGEAPPASPMLEPASAAARGARISPNPGGGGSRNHKVSCRRSSASLRGTSPGAS